MVTIKLGEHDREALGAPEQMSVDAQHFKLSEVRGLAKAGFTPQTLHQGMEGGEVEALAALVWLALARAGIKVPFDELDFDIAEVEVTSEQGEAPAPAGA